MNSAQQVIQLIRDSQLPEAVKAPLLTALEKEGLTQFTQNMVREALGDFIDENMAKAGVDIKNNANYVQSVADYMNKVGAAQAQMDAEMASLQAGAKKFEQDVQPELDDLKAAHVKSQIGQS